MIDELKRMIDAIAYEARAAAPWVGKPDIDPRVLAAMSKIPRHEFVPPELLYAAYHDSPLPIGHGQTISQPYIVALMTELLDPQPGDVILEVGTGSGYQAAVLSLLVSRVYSIEVVQALADDAAARLKRLHHDNVEVRCEDGHQGWPDHAPYDGIVVTAAASEIPQPLIAQLKPGGRLVAPVSDGFLGQSLVVLEKDEQGTLHRRDVLPVAFVPLVQAGDETGAADAPP